MAAIRDGTEGANNLPTLAALGALLCLVFAVLGMKFKGFKHRLNFERLPTEPLRRDVREDMIKVTGVYRIRNLDEDEIHRPMSLPPIKIKQTEDIFSAFKDQNSVNISPVVLRNDKASKSLEKAALKASSKDAKTKKPPAPTKAVKAVKEKPPKVVKAPKTLPPKSPKSAKASPSPKDKASKITKSEPTSSTPPPKSPKFAKASTSQKDTASNMPISELATATPHPKSPKSDKTSPSPNQKAMKKSKSESALNKTSKPDKPASPKKESSSFWSGWFSSSKELKVADPNAAPKKEQKPAKPVKVKKEKPVKEKTPKPAKPVKDKKEKLQKKDIAAPAVKVVNDVPTPQPRSTLTNMVEDMPEVQPRGLPTKSPKSGSRKTVVADVEPNEPPHGILQFVDSKPPQSPDDDFGAWDMVNEHRKSITQTAALASQPRPPPHDTNLRLKDNTAGVLTKPKTMREMKKLSKENAELKMRRSAEAIEADA